MGGERVKRRGGGCEEGILGECRGGGQLNEGQGRER